MKYTIYLDAFFLINFYMDYIILLLVSRILKNSSTHLYLRRFLGAAAGALYVCIILVLRLDGWPVKIISYVGIVLLMSLIINGRTKPKQILKGAAYIYISTCILGGALHILYYYTFAGYFLYDSKGTALMAVISTTLLEPVIHKYISKGKAELLAADTKFAIVLKNNGRKIKLTALMDTGNSLYDPFFNKPVNIVETDCIKGITGEPGLNSYHLIPFSSIGNENGLIPVVRLDSLTITAGKKNIHIEEPLVALYSGKLSANGEFNMILHPEMLLNVNLEMGEKNVFKSNDAK